jgi:hypothetical protein
VSLDRAAATMLGAFGRGGRDDATKLGVRRQQPSRRKALLSYAEGVDATTKVGGSRQNQRAAAGFELQPEQEMLLPS